MISPAGQHVIVALRERRLLERVQHTPDISVRPRDTRKVPVFIKRVATLLISTRIRSGSKTIRRPCVYVALWETAVNSGFWHLRISVVCVSCFVCQVGERVRLSGVLRRRDRERRVVQLVSRAQRLAAGVHVCLAAEAQRLPPQQQTMSKQPDNQNVKTN